MTFVKATVYLSILYVSDDGRQANFACFDNIHPYNKVMTKQ
jgi:hypothetical protein